MIKIPQGMENNASLRHEHSDGVGRLVSASNIIVERFRSRAKLLSLGNIVNGAATGTNEL
jgi:hypothetical protein